MAQRVIRINELASSPAKPGKNATEAKPAKIGKLPVSAATIWRWVREGRFPSPYKLGANVTVWDEDLVDAFIASREKEGQ